MDDWMVQSSNDLLQFHGPLAPKIAHSSGDFFVYFQTSLVRSITKNIKLSYFINLYLV